MRSMFLILAASLFALSVGCGVSPYIPTDPEGVIVSDRAIDMCQGTSYGELQVILETIMAAKDMGMTKAEWITELSSTSPLSDMPCYLALLDQVYADNPSPPGHQDGGDDTPLPPLTVTATSPSTARAGESITCTATANGGWGSISFSWLLTAIGPAGSATIIGNNSQSAVVTFSADAAGTFSFRVTATDTGGQSTSAGVSIVVQ